MYTRIIAVLCLLALPATASAMKLDYRQDIRPAEQLQSAPVITFVNGRPADRGGDSSARIGVIRAGYGWPYAVIAKGDDLGVYFSRWVEDCLAAGGWESNIGAGTASTSIQITLERLWMDGYTGYGLSMAMRVDVMNGGSSLWSWRFDDGSSEVVQWTVNEMNKPLNIILTRQTSALTAAFSSQEFAIAVGAKKAPTTAAAGKTPDSTPGCTKDTDCKGDRICDAGQCVNP